MCERQHFSSYTKKFEIIIGPKLDRVNRPLNRPKTIVRNSCSSMIILYEFWHSLRTLKLKATTDCLGSLTSEMLKASPNDTATRSSIHYFAHIVKVKFVLTHLLTVLTKHAGQHNSFWGSRCDSSHAPTISLKSIPFTAFSALIFWH